MLPETENVGKALLLAITVGFGQMALISFLYMMSILYKKDKLRLGKQTEFRR